MSNDFSDFTAGLFEIEVTKPTKVARDYKPTETQVTALTKYGNKSQAIRGLKAEGHTVSQIADLLNIRYQHVRNVLNQVVKKA